MKFPLPTLSSSIALAVSMIAAPAVADCAEAQTGEDRAQERIDDDLHDGRLDTTSGIIVSAEGLKRFDLLAGTSVIEIEEIQRNLNGQLGEVLAK